MITYYMNPDDECIYHNFYNYSKKSAMCLVNGKKGSWFSYPPPEDRNSIWNIKILEIH